MNHNFKIGDYLTRIRGGWAGMKEGDTGRIIGFSPPSLGVKIDRWDRVGEMYHDITKCRLATPEEIAKAYPEQNLFPLIYN